MLKDTETSLEIFRDTLGLRVVGESENYGTEQEHLNQVFGARLRITALRAAEGLGIKFLEYGSVEKSRQRRSRPVAVLTYSSVRSARPSGCGLPFERPQDRTGRAFLNTPLFFSGEPR